MSPDLAVFLSCHAPEAREEVTWGEMRLQRACYLCGELPPLEYVTSVRGIVLRDTEVMVMTNPDETHIFPGGRRELGESLEETLRREVLVSVARCALPLGA